MNRSAHRRLVALQYRIYKRLEGEVTRLLGETPDSIRKYEREYLKEFPTWLRTSAALRRRSSKQDIIQDMREADVTFVADYHTFSQAQRTALRLIRETIGIRSKKGRGNGGHRWVIGLEMFPSKFQREVDLFQAGELDLKEFLEAVHYQDLWGFPWKNYEPIFEWAREHQVRIVALDRPKELLQWESEKDLKKRDQWAAGVIVELLRDPKTKVIVLFGELHLAQKHLPEQVRALAKSYLGREPQLVRVHQNRDDLYWNLARQEREHAVNVLRLAPRDYCVISGTPWSKLQSLISWVEGDAQKNSGDDDEVDTLSSIQTYGDAIADFLDVPRVSHDDLSLHSIDDADFLDHLENSPHLSSRELALIKRLITLNQRVFIPGESLAFLGNPSPNRSAELAALHLLRTHSKNLSFWGFTREDLFRHLIENSFGFFGSLIINPKRKCDFPEDHRQAIRKMGKRDPIDASARALALECLRSKASLPEDRLRKIPAVAQVIATHYAGQIVGKLLYESLMGHPETSEPVTEEIKRLCLTRLKYAETSEDRWTQLLRIAQPLRHRIRKTSLL